MLGDEGWDPFLEDPASLWLLHWRLLQPPCEATAWYVTFNVFRAVEFGDEDIFKALRGYIETRGRKIADSSLKKDVSCILRMYVESEEQKGVSEDSIDCPFAELGIIQTSGDGRRYSFRVGAKYNLPDEVIVATCLEFAGFRGEQKTISVSSLSYDPGSPGLAFKLSESAICAAIEEVAAKYNALSLSGVAGLIQFAFTEEPFKLVDDILNEYYGRRKRRDVW